MRVSHRCSIAGRDSVTLTYNARLLCTPTYKSRTNRSGNIFEKFEKKILIANFVEI